MSWPHAPSSTPSSPTAGASSPPPSPAMLSRSATPTKGGASRAFGENMTNRQPPIMLTTPRRPPSYGVATTAVLAQASVDVSGTQTPWRPPLPALQRALTTSPATGASQTLNGAGPSPQRPSPSPSSRVSSSRSTPIKRSRSPPAHTHSQRDEDTAVVAGEEERGDVVPAPDFCRRQDTLNSGPSNSVLATLPSIQRAQVAMEMARDWMLYAAREEATAAADLAEAQERCASTANHRSEEALALVSDCLAGGSSLSEAEMLDFVGRMTSLPLDGASPPKPSPHDQHT